MIPRARAASRWTPYLLAVGLFVVVPTRATAGNTAPRPSGDGRPPPGSAVPPGPLLPDPGTGRKAPPHAHPSALFADGWQCDQGYRRVEARCEHIEVPAHAHLTPLGGDSWECDRGYRAAKDACERIVVPPHGRLSTAGDRVDCDPGYVEEAASCVPASQRAVVRPSPGHGHSKAHAEDYETLGPEPDVPELDGTLPADEDADPGLPGESDGGEDDEGVGPAGE